MAGKKKRNRDEFFVGTIFLIVLLADLLTKLLIKDLLEQGESIRVIPGVMHITHHKNFGGGFGILQGQTTLMILAAIVVVGLIIFFYNRLPKDRLVHASVGLILGGAVGNLADRIFLGHVIDFIDLQVWPVFNVADMALTFGVIGILLYYARSAKNKR